MSAMRRPPRSRRHPGTTRSGVEARALLSLWAFALLLAAAGAAAPLAGQARAPLVVTAEIDGIIHPVAAQYIERVVEVAGARDAGLIVVVLRTPGGLVDSTRAINTTLIGSPVPVAVFVGPSGSRAASAGFLITIAADVAAMAPGTHIGAASPVSGTGEKIDDTMAKKITSDVASYARTLAAQRKRNVDLVEKAVTESQSFTEREALAAEPPLIDVIASDVDELLRKLDGREVVRFDGSTVTLRTQGARIEQVEMTRAQRILSALAHPQIAYLLLTLGMLGLTVEFWNPGAIFPGVAGGICLLLAFFAFQVLPVNYVGLVLILFGVVLLALELVVTSFGLLAAGGIVSLALGSMMLFDSPIPELRIGLRLVLPVTLGLSAVILFLVRLAVQSQRSPSVTGTAGMVGEVGQALTSIEPGGIGRVRTHGEIWTATATVPVTEGDTVRVTAVQGLLLTVHPEEHARPAAVPS